MQIYFLSIRYGSYKMLLFLNKAAFLYINNKFNYYYRGSIRVGACGSKNIITHANMQRKLFAATVLLLCSDVNY